MKRTLASFGIFLLVLLFLHGLLSCRSFKKNKSAADSTVVSSQVLVKSFDDQTLTELIIEQDHPFTAGHPVFTFPEIFGLSSADAAGILQNWKAAAVDPDTLAASIGKKSFRSRLVFRKKQSTAGIEKSSASLKKQIHVTQQEKSREPGKGSGLIRGVIGTVIVLLTIWIIIKSKKRD